MGAPQHAIIIGAGIGGMAAGIALRQIGWRVSLFERAEALEAVGAGLSLWANAIRALDRLGLAAEVRALLALAPTGGIYRADGTPLVVTDSTSLNRRVGEVSGVVHRADLQELLYRALEPESLHLGRVCERITQDDGAVTAHFTDGSSASGDLLIGADGLRSVVRAQLVGDGPPVYAGYTAYRGVAMLNLGDVRHGEYWGQGARFGIAPMSAGRIYWFATRQAPAGERLSSEEEKALLLKTFHGWGVPAATIISATPTTAVLRNDVFFRPPLRRWSVGRATLLGDAAHPMTPDMGQGACQALEDAVTLADALSEHQSIAAALSAYERCRIPRTAQVVLQSRRIGSLGQWQHPIACAVRNTLLRLIVAPIQERALANLIGAQVGLC
jgi:2-polyprenyl-6-methoxyphenol hydroxylase-like FAD-dependent oxidoreductase